MAQSGLSPVLIVASLVLVLAIVHLGVSAGIVGQYREYDDIFRYSVALSAFNIAIGVFGIVTAILALVSAKKQQGSLKKTAGILACVSAILSLASLITAMVLISSAVSFVRDRLTYKMATYIQSSESIATMNRVQQEFQCCGVNLWLDWARYPLSATAVGRRRDVSSQSSVLTRSLRERRQTGVYSFPSSWTLNLPLSCCISGGVSTPNAVGGYCTYTMSNGTSGFYVDGCLTSMANLCLSQLSAYVFINTILIILSAVLAVILFNLFSEQLDSNNIANKPPVLGQIIQEQPMQPQFVPAPYYQTQYSNIYSDPNVLPAYSGPVYAIYQ